MTTTTPLLLAVLVTLFLATQPAAAGPAIEALTLGEPAVHTIARGGMLYYSVDISGKQATQSLTVVVTPLAGHGDPDLYGSLTRQYPQGNETDRVAMGTEDDSLTYSPAELAGHDTAWFAVFGFRAAEFSIVASLDDTVALMDGVQQGGQVPSGGAKFYTFTVPEHAHHAEVTFQAIAVEGSVEVLISAGSDNFPQFGHPDSYYWHTRPWLASDAVTVTYNMAHYPTAAGDKFRITLVGLTATNFTLTVSSSAGHANLAPGIPLTEHLESSETEYFKLTVLDAGCRLTVDLTTVSGDPDLFVSMVHKFPNRTSDHTNRSIEIGSDSLLFENAPIGTYYVAVAAFTRATFIITATLQCGNHDYAFTRLTDGRPQFGQLNAGEEAYYKIKLHGGDYTDVSISVTPTVGDCDVYVRADGDWPAIHHWQWRSIHFGLDNIFIDYREPGFRAHADWKVMVYAAGSQQCSYTITASTNVGIVQLQDGMPLIDHLEKDEYEYFSLVVDDLSLDFTVTVTDLARSDPDLFISSTNHRPNASTGSHDFAARSTRSDSITVSHDDPRACQQLPCTYYISVLAYTNSTFSLLATFQPITRLINGVVQAGITVQNQEFRYFVFEVSGTSNSNITITLDTWSGITQLYVKVGKEPTAVVPPDWRVVSMSSRKTLYIGLDDPKRCHAARCQYFIGVRGGYLHDNSTFSITASTQNATVWLQNGRARADQLEVAGYDYFAYSHDDETKDLFIIVTALSGDPDLYVSKPNGTYTNTRPTHERHDLQSRDGGSDMIDIPNAPIGVYYFGVEAYTAAEFSILVLAIDKDEDLPDDFVDLQDGEPQAAFVPKDHYRYYQLRLEKDHAELTINVASTFGDPDLAVTMDPSHPPNMTFYQWRSRSWSEDSVLIAPAMRGTYYIGVLGYSDTMFTLTAASSAASSRLQDGVPVRGELLRHRREYYFIDLVGPADLKQDITVSLTPISGDSDLFISMQYERPNETNARWIGTSYAADSITIAHTDEGFCTGLPCRVYVGIYAYTACRYSVSVSFRTPIQLENGRPQRGTVQKHAMQYYTFFNKENEDVEITVSPIDGTPQLFVAANVTKGSFPIYGRPDTYQYRSSYWSAGAWKRIEATDKHFCHNCLWHIGVYGNHASNYTITVSSARRTIELIDGEAQRAHVNADEWAYFSFVVTRPNVEMRFILTSITGDSDLFISTATHHPDAQHSQFRAYNSGSDAVIIHADQVNHTSPYYIGVKGYRPSTFTIAAIQIDPSDPLDVLQLTDGQPQGGLVPEGEYLYFRFRTSQFHTQITVSVTTTSGDPDLLLNRGTDRPNNTYSWHHSSALGQDMIVLFNQEPGVYTVGIYGYRTSFFAVTYATDDQVTLLQDGRSFHDELVEGEWEYFVLPVDRTDLPLTVLVTTFNNADADLYVSWHTPRPNVTNHDRAAASFRGDAITIPAHLLHKGPYYIGVHAYHNVTFTLQASFDNKTQLQDGVPQEGRVVRETSKYYTFQVVDDHTDVTVSLTPYVGTAWLYINTFSEPDYGHPNTYRWHSTRFESAQEIVIRADDRHFCSNCIYHIMVRGFTDSNYTLTASTSRATLHLIDGVPQREWVDALSYEYFMFDVQDDQADIRISITPFSGDCDLYVSTTETRPTSAFNKHTWSSARYGPDVVLIDHTDRNFRTGTYFIGVFGFATNSSFSIIATASRYTANDTVLLLNGFPQNDYLRRTEVRYYSYAVGDMHKSVRITVTPVTGDVHVYVRNDGTRPSPTHAQWRAESLGRDVISIPHSCRNCQYEIAVVAMSNSDFTIEASTDVVRSTLRDGVPFQEHLNTREVEYYDILVDTHLAKELAISVSAITGDPDVYVSLTNPTPNRTDNYQFSREWGSDFIDIVNPAVGTWHIAVTSYYNCTYTITASVRTQLSSTTLIDGEADEASTALDAVRYYRFAVDDPRHLSDLTFTLSVSNDGHADIYIRTSQNVTDKHHAFPSVDMYQWSTSVARYSQLRGVVKISHRDPQACFNCTYLVTLIPQASFLHESAPVHTSLVASLSNEGSDSVGTLLRDGVSVRGTVEGGKYDYYRFFIDANVNINVMVTTFSGDADIFVSRTAQHPNMTNHWKKSVHAFEGGDHISLTGNETALSSNPEENVLYIAVYGWMPSSYTISVSTSNIMLADGKPMNVVMQPGGTFFVFELANQRQDMRITVVGAETSNFGAEYDLYLNTNSTHFQPNQHNSDWYKRGLTRREFWNIAPTDSRYCPRCLYFLGVYGPAGVFTITASTADSMIQLSDGKEVPGFVAPGESQFYELPLSAADNFTLSLEPCETTMTLYVGQDSFKPDAARHRWAGDEFGKVEVLDRFTDTAIFINVYNPSTEGEGANFVIRTAVGFHDDSPVVQDLNLRASTPEKGTVELRWSSAQSSKGEMSLRYSVYVASYKKNLVMYTRCAVEREVVKEYTLGIRKSTDDDTWSITIDDLDTDSNYIFNVFVYDEDDRYTPYRPTTLKTVPGGDDGGTPSTSGGLPTKLILGVGVPLVLIVVVVIGYLANKNRKLSKELEIELGDIPKRAIDKAVRGPPSAQTQKGQFRFSRLLTEEEEEDDGVGETYIPPM
eukprot:TRINITY_DN64533_c0_g2_i1.p1 TRINITY_DN64533_c0_g2~~TRINITY_DN64533_c0_g2_i1.p1  ORF type:complete len:2597 (-),score=1385.65 TRINITY_DN64533_c0_g2_i1:818-8563(-)